MRTSLLIATSLLLACGAGCATASKSIHPAQAEGPITIDNGFVFVSYNPRDGTFSARRGDRMFIQRGRFPQADAGNVRRVKTEDALGTTRAINVTLASGDVHTLRLYRNQPFIYISSKMYNATDDRAVIDKRVSVSFDVDLGKAPGDLRVLGCDGLTTAQKERTSYTFMAVAEPATRAGVVAGWLTHERASGVVLSKPSESSVAVEARSEYGRLLIEPRQIAAGETFVVGYFDDALNGLEKYAETMAQRYDIKLPRIPCGYCTWYSRPNGRASDEKHIAELAAFCKKQMTKFGFEAMQIDDGWQLSRRDFTTYNPKGPYPHGMKPTARTIKAAGMTAGLWFIPTGWDPNRPRFENHQDWFVHKDDGSIYTVHWAGSCLDMTHPQARAFLSGVVSRITRQWGYKYIKIDGLWSGMAVKALYPKPDYRDDNLGDAVFHDPAQTNVQAYRDGLKLVRKAAGPDVYIVGCNIAQNMRTLGASVGLVDAMRIGRDVSAKWSSIVPCVEMGSRLYFLHNRVWHNDPDCLLVRKPLTLDQARAWASWIALSGQLAIVSEWLPSLPHDRLDIVERCMPNHGLCARPIDLFDSPVPRIWHLAAGKELQKKDVVGLFNWDDKAPATIRVKLYKLGLADGGRYVGFDYWANKFVPPFSKTFEMKLPPSSCRIISIRPLRQLPVLVSTSRHVTQGIVDVAWLSWNRRKNELAGRSDVVSDDPYELRIYAPTSPASWRVRSATVSDADRKANVNIEVRQAGPQVRVTINSPENRRVSWTIVFARN